MSTTASTAVISISTLLVLASIFLVPLLLDWLQKRRQQTLDHEYRMTQLSGEQVEVEAEQVEHEPDDTRHLRFPPREDGL